MTDPSRAETGSPANRAIPHEPTRWGLIELEEEDTKTILKVAAQVGLPEEEIEREKDKPAQPDL